MADVVQWRGVTRLYGDPRKVLAEARDAGLDTAIVIGRTMEGKLYFHSSTPDGGDVLWLVELTKKALLSGELE